jgi:tRNA A-37 threonylcarbamoyl transferase component Bud32
MDPYVYFEHIATKNFQKIGTMISSKSSNSTPINQLQCQYLFDKLCESLADAKACTHGLSSPNIQRSYLVLKSLTRTWKEVEILVGGCCDAQWIQAAMILANAKEHFTSLILKLSLYMQLLQNISKEGGTKEFLIQLQDQEWSDPNIDEIAEKDRQQLLLRLTKDGSIDSTNLIKRLDRPIMIDAWKVAYENVERRNQIGKGTSATVYKVKWLGKQLAEKCFNGPETEAIKKEMSFLAGLSHPNILPLFCVITRANSCSLVIELMDQDLRALMEQRQANKDVTYDPPFHLLEAIDIMLQIAEGMRYLHVNKVVHRDLKSMNIFVKCEKHAGHVYAKVADFGLSKVKEASCTYSNITPNQGTTRWMAPELFNISKNLNVGTSESNSPLKYDSLKADIYSFGMVCYEILTGLVPFHDCELTGLREKILKEGLRPTLPEHCPTKLYKLITTCYHSNPATRPSFREICVKLRHILCSILVACA